jgi:GDP-mannose transporter
VLSSVVAAWADVTNNTIEAIAPASPGLGAGLELVSSTVQKLNIGYMWMLLNCLASAAYVSCSLYFLVPAVTFHMYLQVLAMRKRIKVTGFSDWETMFYNNVLSIPVLAVLSIFVEDWSSDNLARSLSVNSIPCQF